MKRAIMITLCVALMTICLTVFTGHRQSTDGSPVFALAEEHSGKAASGKAAIAAEASTSSNIVQPGDVQGMEIVLQNDQAALYFDKTTTAIAIKQLKSGEIWYSNPPDREQDPLAEAYIKGRMGSQLSMSYFTEDGNVGFIDNFSDSIQKGQFSYAVDKGTLTVNYIIGDISASLAAPKRIEKARFETEILPKITDKDLLAVVKKSYRFVKEAGYYEQWNGIPKGQKGKILDALLTIGYTEKDFAADNKANQIFITPKVNFKATLQYVLDKDNLVVTMPMSKLTQSSVFPIEQISLLEFFGAAGPNEQGYMFIPDGSGALVHLNNHKTSSAPIEIKIYGEDGTIDEKKEGAITEKARMPVFGMKKGSSAMFGIIEKGDAISNVEADVSGRQHSYNVVFSSFNTTARDEVSLSGNGITNEIPIYQEKMYSSDIVVRYAFLSGDEASYSGMANLYRNYLVNKYHMTALKPEEEAPFFLELVGAAFRKTSFLGIPYSKTEAMTTFNEAKEIVDTLKKADISNLKLRYLGWFNGGMLQTLPTSIKPSAALGGTKGFQDLADYLQKEKVEFYPDVSMLHAYKSKWTFGENKNAALFINQKKNEKYPFMKGTGARDRWYSSAYYIVSPGKLPGIVDDFAKAYKTYGISGLSIGEMGSSINADYRKNRMIDRQKAADIIREQTEILAKQFPDELVSGGNTSILPYFSNAVHAPMTSSGYQIADESVPFYEMVLHGYIDYAGEPANMTLGGDLQKYTLHLLETGANVYFQWMYKSSSLLKDTEFDYLFSNKFSDWLTEAKSMYSKAAPVLKKVRNHPIIKHEKLDEGVYQTTYEGGITVTVNYNTNPMNVKGLTLPAQGFLIGGENP